MKSLHEIINFIKFSVLSCIIGLIRFDLCACFVLILFLLPGSPVTAQNYNWIAPNQTYLKMYVSSDGMYRIDKSDFVNAGISVSSIDPRTVKVYFKGSQMPIYFYGEDNGAFDDGDYFDFFGMRNYGGLTNAYNINNAIVYTTDEHFNLYSDTSAYFVGWGGAFGLRYLNYNNSSFNLYPNNFYYEKLHYEQDLIYSLGQSVSSQDYGYYSNDKYIGEGWYWRVMQTSNFFDQIFNVNSLPVTPQQCRLKVFAYPGNQNTSITNEHRLVPRVNTTLLDTMYRDNYSRFDTTVLFSSSLLVNGNNTMRFLNRPAAGFAGIINFDMFELYYPRQFVFDSSSISFNSDVSDSSAKIFKIKGFLSSNQLNIYDTKNGVRISNYSFLSDTLIFVGKGNGNYQIINKTISRKPFRIKQRQVPNLVTSSAGVDYLIVYNKLFEGPAEQLRHYRNTKDGYRSYKAEIEDIYDIFNFGMEDPVAVRRFVKNVYDTWTLPKVKFLCLFGRGSIDPKKNFGASSIYYQNYIPVYGNPVTDGYFANFNFGAFTYTHQISVGRLPAYTNQEAQDMVTQIFNYESQELQEWLKKPTFITGGYSRSDQLQFIAQSNYFINSYIIPPITSSEPHKIYLNDTSGQVTYNYSDSIRNTFNRGTILVNFIAHASSGFWDYVFSEPSILSNGNRNPLVLSMTCFTGKTAEYNSRSYGEKFMIYPNKGAIGFISTTGWSFSNTGNIYNDYLLRGFSKDTLRRTGDILKKASQLLSPDSSSFAAKNTNNCYGLIGDPAVKLLFPNYPEFEIKSDDYFLSNNYPSLREKIFLKAFPKNLGISADSCKINVSILKNNLNYFYKDTILYNFGFNDTIKYIFSFDSIGIYKLKINIDPDKWWSQENKGNNILETDITIKNNSFYPLFPQDNQKIQFDTIKFTGINPNIKTEYIHKLVLQIDTVSTFNSGYLINYFVNKFNGPITKLNIKINDYDTNKLFFWRTNVITTNKDSLGWSNFRRFKFKSFNINNDSTIYIRKENMLQYDIGDFFKTGQYYNYISNLIYEGSVQAFALGENYWDPSYMIFNNIFLSLIGRVNAGGLHVVKLLKKTGYINDYKHFYFSSNTSSDSLVNFLSTFDSTHIFVSIKGVPFNVTNNLNNSARNALKSFGSYYADSINLLSWNRWSFISYNNMPNPIVSESYRTSSLVGDAALSSMYPLFTYPSGTITQTFGPAQTWKNFNWEQELFPNSNLYFNVYGINRNNQETLLMSNITSNSSVDLSGINAYQYPHLKLITYLSIDSVNGFQSPVFKGINLNYVGPPEIALDNNSIYKSDSVVSAGDSIGIGGLYYNVGYVPINGHVRTFYALDAVGNKVHLRTDTVLAQLKVDSSMFVKATFKVNGLPIHKKYNNQVSIVLEVHSLNQNDIYDYNNSVISTFVVKGSITDINTEVFSDGIKLFGNDYVRSNPEILVKLTGNSVDELLSTDTSVFRIMLNNNFISLNPANSKSKERTSLIKETDKGTLILKFTPQLQNGINDLKLITFKNNSYDTAKFVLNVTNEISLVEVNNYPNPMKNETTFTFTFTGQESQPDCRIKIYSSTGRVIKEIIINGLKTGVNQIHWDGRDGDGDYIANGVYFYRVVFKGTTEAVSDIRKLVVLK